MKLAFLLVVFASATGCTIAIDSNSLLTACASERDCLDGFGCFSGVCAPVQQSDDGMRPPFDGGLSVEDGGNVDSGSVDLDGGNIDSDAGLPGAIPQDAGDAFDSGFPDAGRLDGGLTSVAIDGGDSDGGGSADGGEDDAGDAG